MVCFFRSIICKYYFLWNYRLWVCYTKNMFFLFNFCIRLSPNSVFFLLHNFNSPIILVRALDFTEYHILILCLFRWWKKKESTHHDAFKLFASETRDTARERLRKRKMWIVHLFNWIWSEAQVTTCASYKISLMRTKCNWSYHPTPTVHNKNTKK